MISQTVEWAHRYQIIIDLSCCQLAIKRRRRILPRLMLFAGSWTLFIPENRARTRRTPRQFSVQSNSQPSKLWKNLGLNQRKPAHLSQIIIRRIRPTPCAHRRQITSQRRLNRIRIGRLRVQSSSQSTRHARKSPATSGSNITVLGKNITKCITSGIMPII